MKLLIVDDEALALRNLHTKLTQICKDDDIAAFMEPLDALEYIRNNLVEVALLDMEMGNMNGIRLAKQIKDIWPDIKIIFVTGFEQYAVDAFAIHVSGYLLKPVKLQELERELDFAYGNLRKKRVEKHIRIQTFGGFDVFVDEVLLKFKRSKTKELFAYLVDRRGISVTTREACAILWEDEPYNINLKNYFQQLIMDMRITLMEAEVEDILIRNRNALAIIPEKMDCDSYKFQNGDIQAINTFRHDYMICYSWAEFTMGFMEQQLKENINK